MTVGFLDNPFLEGTLLGLETRRDCPIEADGDVRKPVPE